jgi:hypothetical protein
MGNCCITRNRPKIFLSDLSNVPRLTYEGQYKYCIFNHIYDGDTADIFFYDNNRIIRAPFRFYGYDSAEMKPLKSAPNRQNIIAQAQQDKEYLSSLILNKQLVVQLMHNEKYGRMMGIAWIVIDTSVPEDELSKHPELIDANCVNKQMINSGHGKIYFGGKKE